MDGQILDSVTEWDTVPVGEGAQGLADLVGQEFTGAVSDGVAWLFLLNGRGVGVVDGSVDDFEDADLTARRAPDDSLPLLYAMMSGGAETRAKYYTEETPLSSAHETLSNGGFTGFVELSENVLSGDYYVVYYGGRSLPVAFVGSSRTLLTGDEAFERADDEVGIYHVREAGVEILDLPTPDDSADHDAAVATGDSDGEGIETNRDDEAEGTDEADEDDEPDSPSFDATAALGGDTSTGQAAAAEDQDVDEQIEADETDASRDDAAGSEAASTGLDAADASDETGADETTDGVTEAVDDAEELSEDAAGDGQEEAVGNGQESPDSDASERTRADDVGDESTGGETREEPTANEPDDDPMSEVTFGGSTTAADDDDRLFEAEAEWRETQVIPPLSPDDETKDLSTTPNRDADDQRQQANSGQSHSTTASTDERSEALDELRERLQRAEAERDEAEERIATIEAERDELQTERDELQAEARRLRERVEELESTIERLEGGTEQTPETSMTEESALAGTSLFVRYETKGEATLEKAHDGDAERDEVNENLRLEYHTTFESDPVSVDGCDFERFLYDTVEYRFVKWLIEGFIYELQSTGNAGSMQELYDVLPEIDRVEFRGNVSLQYEEDGKEHREQREFDVVCRDRMGNELAVADINDSREATSESDLSSLVEGTRRLAETKDTVAAAFAVTGSFFDPEALEMASEATKSGLLGRSKGKSYVKLSRKRGFHLCLVETRDDNFHVNVPEL